MRGNRAVSDYFSRVADGHRTERKFRVSPLLLPSENQAFAALFKSAASGRHAADRDHLLTRNSTKKSRGV